MSRLRPFLSGLTLLAVVSALLLPAAPAPAQASRVFVPPPPAAPPLFVPAGRLGQIGPAGSASQAINVKTFTPPLSALTLLAGQTAAQALASFQPAQGDGIHDDTSAIQAAMDYAAARSSTATSPYQRLRVFLPASIYRVTAPLTIDRAGGGIYAGFDIEGAGTSPQGQPLEGGTIIRQTGAAQDSVLWVKGGSFQDSRIADLSLVMASDTRYGLHLGSQYSRLLLSRVTIQPQSGTAHGTGVYQEYPTSGNANGEQTVLDDVIVNYLDRLFDFRSGQAFGLHLVDCGGQPNNGGTALSVGVGDNGGYQALVENFSASAATGPLPNTLFNVGVISGNFTAISTRSEKFDMILALGGQSNGVAGQVTLSDSHFDSITAHAPLVTGGSNSGQYFVALLRDKFSALTPGMVLTIPPPGDFRHTVWGSDLFENFAPNVSLGPKPDATKYPFNGYPGATITDCWQFSASAPVMAAVTN